MTQEGKLVWPDPTPLPPQDASVKKKVEVAKPVDPAQLKRESFRNSLKSALGWGVGLTSYIGMALALPDPTFLTMLTTFSLSLIAGYQSVWGVVPALLTPLMSVTNAISGITAAGGLLVMGGGYFPHTLG